MTRLLFALAVALSQAPAWAADAAVPKPVPGLKTATGTDASDLWWVPSESGWGMQLVQESDTMFATLFIYGADGKPTWVVAQLESPGTYTYTGPLYATTGPWFGGPFDPAAVGVRPAGSMTFTLQTIGTGQLTYSIDGVQVTKQVERQTIALENYTGNFLVASKIQATGCFNPSGDAIVAGGFVVNISQSGNTMSMIWQFPNGAACTYSGGYAQSGHLGTLGGDYTCTTGEVGQMVFFEMTNRPSLMNGRLVGRSSNLGCQYTGYFAGIDPSRAPN